MNPWLCKLSIVILARVPSYLPVSKNTLKPFFINVLYNLSTTGFAGHIPLFIHALNVVESNGSHLQIFIYNKFIF